MSPIWSTVLRSCPVQRFRALGDGGALSDRTPPPEDPALQDKRRARTTLSWSADEPGGPAVGVSAETGATSDMVAFLKAALPRYEDLGLLGRGGMGEVRRVRDVRLGRVVALKVVHTHALARPALVARFLEEAQATAQLQHPNIIPIYDLGELPDGRVWFTMKEVGGTTLDAVLNEVRSSRSHWGPCEAGEWGRRRVVSVLQQVCEAVEYAHTKGVVHRDLKPSNIMIGRHGEVLVMDWGLAKIMGQSDALALETMGDVVRTDRSEALAFQTQIGAVAGTPTYMAPEQALGQTDAIDERTDIYALGVMLYEVLAGHPPYGGCDARAVLEEVRAGPPPPLDETHAIGSPVGLPRALVEACECAMAWDAADRFASAGALSEALQGWLDGSQRRQDALTVFRQAEELAPQAAMLRERAGRLRAEASALLEGVASWQPEESKLPGWDREDEAVSLERQAEMLEIQEEQLLHASLTHAPELTEAHAALAARYRTEHATAEAERVDAARAEARLRRHVQSLPQKHADVPVYAAYLKGDGALSLVTEPPGAEVQLSVYELRRRRLEASQPRSLGVTPLLDVTLPMGSYLCRITHPDCHPALYPVFIGRGEHWTGVPPEGGQSVPVRLLPRGSVGPNESYVPAGWAWLGGDSEARDPLVRRRVWVDGFVAQRFPVTNREYLDFLTDLVSQGRTEEALAYAPRERSGTEGGQGPLIVGFDGHRFVLRPDADGDIWEPDYPVTMVTHPGACAYAEWFSEQTGQPWQLPTELQWEKAARGVDGRNFPWGDGFDPSWACMKKSHEGRQLPAVISRFPTDCSPYGLRGMAGNAVDWCADLFSPEGSALSSARCSGPSPEAGAKGYRVLRGGGWYSTVVQMRAASRRYLDSTYRGFDLSFRLVRWV